MTNRAATLLPALLLAAAAAATATTAHADAPVAAAAPAPAAPTTGGPPQNADWSDLSHINGQLVKVGETNDYHKTFKRTIISTNPVAWMLGSYGVSLSYGINDHVAIRGDVNYLSNYLTEDLTGVEVGIGAPIYFRRTYQGVFLEPGFISRRFEYKGCFDCSAGSTETATTVGPQMLVGWHWTWDSGLNVAVAGGIGRNWSSDSSQDEPFVNGYLRFGYAF
jgi:hypothetical protein